MRKYKRWIIGFLIMLLLLGIVWTARALTLRQQNNAALRCAKAHLASLYPDAEKIKHRVIMLNNQERMVLINLQNGEELLYCAVQIGETDTILWSEVHQEPENETDEPLFYIAKSGECYHKKANCSGMKAPLAIPAPASNIIDDALRACTRCDPVYPLPTQTP